MTRKTWLSSWLSSTRSTKSRALYIFLYKDEKYCIPPTNIIKPLRDEKYCITTHKHIILLKIELVCPCPISFQTIPGLPLFHCCFTIVKMWNGGSLCIFLKRGARVLLFARLIVAYATFLRCGIWCTDSVLEIRSEVLCIFSVILISTGQSSQCAN